MKGDIRKATGRLGKVVVARLAPGCDLMESLEEIAREENIKAGVILSGAASLRQAALRNVGRFPKEFPITDEIRVLSKRNEPMELLSIAGNISVRDGEVFIHGHITISSGEENGQAYGGHLTKGNIIFSTGEIMIAEIDDIAMERLPDPETKNIELYARTV